MAKSLKVHLDTTDQILQLSSDTHTKHRRINAADWKTSGFINPVTSAWDLYLPQDQVSILLRGTRPRERQDKWFVYADDNLNANGIATLHIFQSWSGCKMAEIEIKIPTSTTSTEPPKITNITWESDENTISGNSEERAKRTVRELYTWVLARQAPTEEPILMRRPNLTKSKSWRSGLGDRLSELNSALQPTQALPPKLALRLPSPEPSPPTWRIVDVPRLDIAIRPTVFNCPPSP
jgi:hypothetical protein